MSNKLLATIAIFVLLIGTFGIVLNFAPAAKADTQYVILTIDYAPSDMDPAPLLAPTVGEHNITKGSQINITAPLIVNGTSAGVRYVFLNWMKTFTVNGTFVGNCSLNSYTTPALDDNYTYTACYKEQFLFTVTTPFDTAWIYDPTVPQWRQETSRWFDKGTTGVKAGLSTGRVDIAYAHRAFFINWTGDATGGPESPITSSQHSDPLNMTGPMNAVAEWVEKYYLWTGSSYYPWGPGSPYDPDNEGYKPECTYVDLTAPTYDSINPNHWRWRFDRWEIEKWNYTSGAWELAYIETTENITVHIDAPTTATVYFHLQYYLTVTDSPSAIDSGVESQSDYYDYCSNVTLVAPEYVADPSDPGIRWVFKEWYIANVIDCYNTTLTVHIGAGWDKTAIAIYTKEYYLDVSDNIGGLSCVSTQSGWFKPSTVVPLSAPCIIPVDTGTRYVFVQWVKDPGHYVDPHCNTTITMVSPRNATAYYKKQYKGTWTADPSALNAKISGWPGENWFDANTKVKYTAPSLLADLPYDWYFDHWTVNGVPQTQYHNIVYINFTEPINGVAHYLGKSAFFINPQMVVVDAPAECTTFTVNVTAANLVDLYAFDFKVTWDPTLLNLTAVDVEVDEIWTQYFIAKNEINNTAGTYWLVATSLDDYGFNGTHKVVALTFHIIYDPCYLIVDYYRDTPLTLTVNKLADSNGYEMHPGNVHGGYYRINAIQPILEMRPSQITVSQKDVEFNVEIWIVNAVKLHDWHANVSYNNAQLQAIDVEINKYFLTGPYVKFSWTIDQNGGFVVIEVVQAQPGETLAYGEGLLATIKFKVIKSIFWTTASPKLTSDIKFIRYTYISVKCPGYAEIYGPTLKLVGAKYTYDPIPGDLNMDGVVNVLDLQLVAADYGSHTTYDLNNDSKVDLLDLVLVAINYGRNEP